MPSHSPPSAQPPQEPPHPSDPQDLPSHCGSQFPAQVSSSPQFAPAPHVSNPQPSAPRSLSPTPLLISVARSVHPGSQALHSPWTSASSWRGCLHRTAPIRSTHVNRQKKPLCNGLIRIQGLKSFSPTDHEPLVMSSTSNPARTGLARVGYSPVSAQPVRQLNLPTGSTRPVFRSLIIAQRG